MAQMEFESRLYTSSSIGTNHIIEENHIKTKKKKSIDLCEAKPVLRRDVCWGPGIDLFSIGPA